MMFWAIFWPDGRFLRYADTKGEAALWATAIKGTYKEVDLGG